MATKIGIGYSEDINIERAAKDAAFISKTNLEADHIDFALVFLTIHYNPPSTLPIIYKVLNQSKIIGSTTAGIILSDKIITRGVAVLTISSDEMEFGIGAVDDVNSKNSHAAGMTLAQNTLADFAKQGGRHAFLYFADGNFKNSSEFLKGIQEVFGNIFPIVGAGSTDDFHFQSNFQIYKNNVLKNSATGVIMGGSMSVGVGGRHGWRPLGRPRLIEEVEGNVIKVIDGKYASSLYEEYFGSEMQDIGKSHLSKMAILYPLGIFVEGSDEYLLKNAVEIRQDGSIVCQGDVPNGSEVHIMIGSKESCRFAAIDAAHEANKNLLGKSAKLIIIVESMARLKLLGRKAFDEVRHIKEIFGSDVPIIGMFSHGEICPFQTVERYKKPHLQNESIVITAIG